jgi:hypothetical protein
VSVTFHDTSEASLKEDWKEEMTAADTVISLVALALVLNRENKDSKVTRRNFITLVL